MVSCISSSDNSAAADAAPALNATQFAWLRVDLPCVRLQSTGAELIRKSRMKSSATTRPIARGLITMTEVDGR